MSDLSWAGLLILAAILAARYALQCGHLRVELLAARVRSDAAESELAAAQDTIRSAHIRATAMADQAEAVTADHQALLEGIREVADALDQGAHKVAARRLRTFADHHTSTSRRGNPR